MVVGLRIMVLDDLETVLGNQILRFLFSAVYILSLF